ncbi:hypothetical protein PANO66_03502 [Planktothrix agardhii]|jgi:hypothetical protein|uniref:Uncharacterized protein n=1 Tax=Planktothrix agardhii TaxID=1160 RepID=A0AAD1Q6P7_PLAAG|nr:hypothetical protein NIES204_40090 [Planktothrix agardhii NIES-204]CAD5964212.1 hypothetical protein PANO66_03502 [Planktothrix agardhii]
MLSVLSTSRSQKTVEPEHETYHGQNPTTKSQIKRVVLPLHIVPTGDPPMCYIPIRYSEAEVAAMIAPLQACIAELEKSEIV